MLRNDQPNTIFKVREINLWQLISWVHVAFLEYGLLVSKLLANLKLMVLILIKLEHLRLHAPAHDVGVVLKSAIWRLLECKFENTLEEWVCEELGILEVTVVRVTLVFLDADAFVKASDDQLELLATQDVFVAVDPSLVFDEVFFLEEDNQEDDQGDN